MASFSAELHVAGHVFPVLHCHYGVHQATHQRGRVSTKVRHEPVSLTLSVPEGDALLAWAAEASKRQAATVVFRAANGGSPLETLVLAAAYCVSYQEAFASGDATTGAYVCYLVLADPDGFTLQAGGPATAFVAPAARQHGTPGAAESLATRAIGGGGRPISPANLAPTPQEKARFAELNRLHQKQALLPAQEPELLKLLATVEGIHVPGLAHLSPKPKHSPTPAKWKKKGGRIDVLANGYWQYTDEEGNSVTYEPDEPNFDAYARQQVDIDDMQGDCTSDFKKADRNAPLGACLDENTWHHKNNLCTMQEVPYELHKRFTHFGARSIINRAKPAHKKIKLQKR